MKSHLSLMEDAPANYHREWYLTGLAKSLKGQGHASTIGPVLASRIDGAVTRVDVAGDRAETEVDWREDDYMITELECRGSSYCLLESGGEAMVIMATARGLFGWLCAPRQAGAAIRDGRARRRPT